MSFHKLKIGSRKKESTRSTTNSHEKFKQKGEDLNLNLETKLHSKKANIISMSDDFNHQIFKLKKSELPTAPKTDRVHKIQTIESFNQYESLKGNSLKPYHFSYGNNEENQQYSASQVIEFLNVKQTENKTPEGASLKMVKNSIIGTNSSGSQSQKPPVSQSAKPRVHQIKQMTPTEVETKVKNAFEIRKKTIQLEQQLLNFEIGLAKKESTEGIIKNSNSSTKPQVAQNSSPQNQTIKTVREMNKVQITRNHEEKIVHLIKKESWSSSGSVETRDNQLSASMLIVKTAEKVKDHITQEVKVLSQSPLSEKSSKSNTKDEGKAQVSSVQLRAGQKIVENSVSSVANNVSSVSNKVTLIPVSQTSSGISTVSSAAQDQPIQSIQSSPTKSKLSYRPINQVQVTILQQNKILTQEVQKIRKERDELQFMNKRYEVQLMQSNCQDYYEREIKRLRAEVENLQANQEELKHNNFQLQNKCKQLESSEDINKREIKKLLKQLQAIKIDSTKQKHQLKQKTSSLQFVIKQLEQRNADLSNKFQDYYKKYNDLQKAFKIKSQDQHNLKKYALSLQSKLTNTEKAAMEKLKHYENGLNTNTTAKSQLESEYREFRRQSETQIQSLRQNIKQLNLKRQSQTLLISSRIKTLEKHNNTIEAELQVVRLEETVKQLQTQISKRSELIRELNNKIDSMISMKDYEELRKQLELVNLHKAQLVQDYEKEILALSVNIEQLKNSFEHAQKELQMLQHDQILCETTKSNSQSRPNDHSLVQKENFKEILKQQILESDNLKQELFSKSQLHFKLKEEYEELKVKHESLRNELQIMKKQFSSQGHNSKIKNEIVQQELVNEIDSMKRKIMLLEKRFDSKVRENREKEQFIKDFIIGNGGSGNDSQYLVKELERIFLEKEKIESQRH